MPQDRPFRAPRLEPLEYETPAFGAKAWESRVHEYVGLDVRIDRRHSDTPPPLDFAAGAVREVPFDGVPEVRMLACDEKKCVFIEDRATGRCVGMSGGGGMPYVLPEFRGRGYGSAALFLKERLYHRLRAISYSPEGVMNRAAVHKHHVSAALAAGHAVPDRVIQDYAVSGGRARLREPYTAERHEALRDRYLDTLGRERYEKISSLMSFETAYNPRSLIENHWVYTHDAQPFILAAHRAVAGSKILRIPAATGYSDYAVHDKAAGVIVDIYGVRPENAFREEIGLRHRKGDGVLKATVLRAPGIEKFTREASRKPLRGEAMAALVEVMAFLSGAEPTYARAVEDAAPAP